MLRFSFISLATIISVTAASAQSYNRIISFGDSHSDNGNSLPVYGFTQSSPHVNGRLTNGLLWNEILAANTTSYRGTFGSMDRVGVNSMVSDPVNNNANVNYAVAGWRGQDMAALVNSYKTNGGNYGVNNLITVAYGSNDVSAAISAGATSATIGAIMNTAVTTMQAQMQAQIGQGARNFLVLNLHDRGDAPFFAGGTNEALARQATLNFNTSFTTQMNQLAANNANTNIIQMDFYGLQKAIQANPTAFGFLSSTTSCFNVTGCSTATPAVQNQYFRWDQYHYTEGGHRIIARAAEITLNYGKDSARFHTITDTAMLTRLSNMNSLFDKIAQSRTNGGLSEKGEVSLEALGELRQTLSSDNRDSSTTQLAGARLSLSKALNQNLALGLNATFQTGSVNQGNITYDTTQLSIDAFASLQTNGYFVNAGLGFTQGSFDRIKRIHTLGGLENTGATNGNTLSAALEIGKRFQNDNNAFTPLMRITGVNSSINGFSEQGLLAPLTLNSRQSSMMVAALEARFDRTLATMSLHGLVGVQALITSTGNGITGNLSNNSSLAQTTNVGAPQINGLYLGAGLNKMVTQSLSMGINYRANLSKDTQHKVNGGMKFNF